MSIPLVLMSGGGDAVAKAQELGVDDYLVKPISLRNLMDVVGRYCEKQRV